MIVPLLEPLVIVLATFLVEASLVTCRKFDARDVKAVFVVVVIIVQVDYKVIRSVVVCCPVLAERIQFTSIDGVRERLPVNQVTGLGFVDPDVDLDIYVAITGGVRLVADFDGVILVVLVGVLGLVIPAIEPLVFVTAATAFLIEASLVTR